MKLTTKLLSGAALAVALMNCAQATPVDWTADLSFTSPVGRSKTLTASTLTGTFTYDADTQTTSNVNLALKYAINGITYNYTLGADSTLQAGYGDYGSLQIDTSGTAMYLRTYGQSAFMFGFGSSALTNAGGVLNLALVGNVNDILTTSMAVKSFSGTLTGVPQATAVPEPEAYAMMLAGLGLVGFAARRKQAA